MSKYDDIVKETIVEVLEEIEDVLEEWDGAQHEDIFSAIKERLSEKFNVEVDL